MTKQELGFTRTFKCISNTGYPSSLEVGKVYWGKVVQRGAYAVIDESGESYAYGHSFFEIVDEAEDDDRNLIMDDSLDENAAEEAYQAYPDAIKRDFEQKIAELRNRQ